MTCQPDGSCACIPVCTNPDGSSKKCDDQDGCGKLCSQLCAAPLSCEPGGICGPVPCVGDTSYNAAAVTYCAPPTVLFVNLMLGIPNAPDADVTTRIVGGNARQALNITGFAYFPLLQTTAQQITYGTIKSDTKSGSIQTISNTTTDPWVPLGYYASQTYTMISTYMDAVDAGDKNAPFYKKVVAALFVAANTLFSEPLPGRLSWTSYVQHPGCNGTAYPDGVTVTWTTSCNGNSIYLGPRDYFDQFWPSGNVRPPPNATLYVGMQAMIAGQVQNVLIDYENVLNMGTPWNEHILDRASDGDDPHVDVFHQLRKDTRALGQSIPLAAGIFTWYYKPIPQTVYIWLETTFPVSKSIQAMATYGDALGFNDPSSTQYGLGYLLLVGDTITFPASTFWQLTDTEYNSIRSAVIMYTLKTSLGKSATFAKQYPTAFANATTINAYPATVPPFALPTFDTMNGFSGLFGEVDDLMGTVHDVLVIYQKSAMSTSDKRAIWAQAATDVVAQYLTAIDYPTVVAALTAAFCRSR